MTDHQTLDFYHASEYVGKAAAVMFKEREREQEKREAWLGDQLHQLKHKRGAAGRLFSLLEEYVSTTVLKNTEDATTMLATITYLQNQKGRMNYSYSVERNWPIGSGVTEAACKTLIKQRLCKWAHVGRMMGLLPYCQYAPCDSPLAAGMSSGNIDQYGCPRAPA